MKACDWMFGLNGHISERRVLPLKCSKVQRGLTAGWSIPNLLQCIPLLAWGNTEYFLSKRNTWSSAPHTHACRRSNMFVFQPWPFVNKQSSCVCIHSRTCHPHILVLILEQNFQAPHHPNQKHVLIQLPWLLQWMSPTWKHVASSLYIKRAVSFTKDAHVTT